MEYLLFLGSQKSLISPINYLWLLFLKLCGSSTLQGALLSMYCKETVILFLLRLFHNSVLILGTNQHANRNENKGNIVLYLNKELTEKSNDLGFNPFRFY